MGEAHRLVMDVGGSFIKYAVATGDGQLLPGSIGQAPANAQESAEEIFEALGGIIRPARSTWDISDACVSMPGPFDFENDVSRMKHKFPALYGQNLLTPFEREGLPATFLHDSTAFILGEYYAGTLQGAQNACCVMLGTGLGFSWIRDGRVCVDESQTPALALWRSPYLDGIAEDYVSTRAIQKYYGSVIPVKEIAELARAGDGKAKEAFQTAAFHLSAILRPLLERLHCGRLALGGQISKSAGLLPLNLTVPWQVSGHPDDAALIGAGWYGKLGKNACIQVIPRMQY